MNKLLSRAPQTPRLSTALVIAYLVGAFLPGFPASMALLPCLHDLATLPALVLHSVVFGSLGHWLVSSLSLICSALVCGKALSGRAIVGLWIGSTLLGALVYLAAADSCSPFVGPAAFAWGFAGAACTAVVLNWKGSHWLVKGYVAVVLLGLTNLLQVSFAVAALQAAGLSFGCLIAYKACRRGRRMQASRLAKRLRRHAASSAFPVASQQPS